MAASDADLMSIGRHCAHEGCNQLDFLPFRCSRCRKVYCLEHRVCPCNQDEDTVLVCPLCAKAVICPPGQDVELAFDRHTRTDCDPSNYDRVHRKQRCPVSSCKERLTSVNSYICRDCGVTVCLKHRLPSDHKCPGRRVVATSAAQSRLSLPLSWRRMFSVAGTSSGSAAPAVAKSSSEAARQQPRPTPPQQSQRPPTGGVAAKTRDAIQSQLQQYRQQQQHQKRRDGPGAAQAPADVVDLTIAGSPARSTLRGPAAVPTGPELCQQCGARFATVRQLIEHAESVHAAGWSSGAIDMQQQQQQRGSVPAAGRGSGLLERCPHCGREFSDPVQLVAHVEQQHAAETSSTCVCS